MTARRITTAVLLLLASVATGALLTWVALGVGVDPEHATDPSGEPSGERAEPEEGAR
jgi:hypothetical protein